MNNIDTAKPTSGNTGVPLQIDVGIYGNTRENDLRRAPRPFMKIGSVVQQTASCRCHGRRRRRQRRSHTWKEWKRREYESRRRAREFLMPAARNYILRKSRRAESVKSFSVQRPVR